MSSPITIGMGELPFLLDMAKSPSSEPVRTSFLKETIHILLLEGVAPRAAEMLQKEGFNVEYHKTGISAEELKKKIPDFHVIGIRSGTKLTKEVLELATNLLAIGCFCIGTNQVDLETAEKLGICVFNSPFCNTRSVAELIIAQLIGLSRFLGDKNKELHSGIWNKSSKDCHEIRAKVLGIVGYGHIGSQLSVLAEAMGMRVIFHDIVPKLPLGNSKQVENLKELLERSDYVSLHVPATPETKYMITKEEIDIMNPGSYLLNASRGNVVVIEDLVAALTSGHLRGAYIDVYPSEPKSLVKDWSSPLREIPNVLLTPHIGGSTEEAQASIGLDLSAKIASYITTGSTVSSVNFPKIGLCYDGTDTHRIVNVHKNQPGVLRDINNILAEYNITRQVLGTKKHVGYLIVEVDREAAREIAKQIDKIEACMITRILY